MKKSEVMKRQAIVIDCEMVGVKNNHQAVAFLTAIDFLNGDVLISRYVASCENVLDWRSKITGVTEDTMKSAVLSGAAFKDWREAREKLWEFADSSTVFVGQSLNYDLEVLGICHSKIVDSSILTAEAVFPSTSSAQLLPRAWSLKTLAKELLGLEIQNFNFGHNALEDAHAVRDVVIFCIRNPEQLKIWAELRREEARGKGKKGGLKGKAQRDSGAARTTEDIQHEARKLTAKPEYHKIDEWRWPNRWPRGSESA